MQISCISFTSDLNVSVFIHACISCFAIVVGACKLALFACGLLPALYVGVAHHCISDSKEWYKMYDYVVVV
jgi:hypothetical protein